MRDKKGNSRFLLSIAVIIIFYIGLILTYYFDLINSTTVVVILTLVCVVTIILLLRYRNKKPEAKRITFVLVLVSLLFFFDSLLLQYDSFTFETSYHVNPLQAAANSGINIMAVGSWDILYTDDRDSVVESFESERQELIEINKVDNKKRFHSRNNNLLQFLGFHRDADSEMAKNVEEYLGDITEGVESYLKREDIEGNSAGLALVLTGLIEQGKLKNGLELGITGAIDETGKVKGIGMVKEKVIIAEKKEYRFIIIPSENAEEAEEVKKEQNLEIQIFAVSHIDETIELIDRLNENYEE